MAEDRYRAEFVEYADYLFFSAANQADPRIFMELFLERKPEQVIIAGMSAQGCALGSGDGIHYFKAVDMERPVVDTNGAGDSLAIGFLSSHILDGYSLEEAILRGQIAARYTCSLKASSSNLITIEKLNNYFQDYHH